MRTQEVQNIIPEVVEESSDGLTVSYGNITAVLIEAIKEQQALIQSLNERISLLEKHI